MQTLQRRSHSSLMSRHIYKAPPLSRYAPPRSTSLDGLERVVHEPPKALSHQAQASGTKSVASSRKSSTASINKPLPPEPVPPLFTTTPSPKTIPAASYPAPGYTPSPPCLVPMIPPKERAVDVATVHVVKGTDIKLKDPFAAKTGTAGDRLTPIATGGASRPVSATPSAIIDSYANRDHPNPVDRAGTPLVAPHAQNASNLQRERLQGFERFDPNTLLPASERMPVASTVTTEEQPQEHGEMQRKDTLAYRFDTPTESNPQISFQQPLWAEDHSQSAEDVAMKYRNTLLPGPFSPTSEYGDDDEIVPTPTIPLLPPLPANSPFRVAEPEVAVEYDPRSKSPPIVAPRTKPPPARHSARNSRETSHQPRPQVLDTRSPQTSQFNPHFGPREFGSQASWEPGDDSGQLRQLPAASRTSSLSRSQPVFLPMGSSSSSTQQLPKESPALPSVRPDKAFSRQNDIGLIGIPSTGLTASTDRSMSSNLQVPGHNRSETVASFETDTYVSPAGQQSHFSDDSDEGSKTRAFSFRLKKKQPQSKAKSAGEASSGKSSRTTLVSTPTNEVGAFSERRSASIRPGSGPMPSSLHTAESTGEYIPNLGPVQTMQSSQMFESQEDRTRDSLLPILTPRKVAQTLLSHPDVDVLKAMSIQRSSTWAAPTNLASKSPGEKKRTITSPKSEISWFSRLRGKKKVEAEREKWRESLKQKIKVVPSEASDVRALVVTEDMKARAPLGGNGVLKHF